jgi:hypothetical protein
VVYFLIELLKLQACRVGGDVANLIARVVSGLNIDEAEAKAAFGRKDEEMMRPGEVRAGNHHSTGLWVVIW